MTKMDIESSSLCTSVMAQVYISRNARKIVKSLCGNNTDVTAEISEISLALPTWNNLQEITNTKELLSKAVDVASRSNYPKR